MNNSQNERSKHNWIILDNARHGFYEMAIGLINMYRSIDAFSKEKAAKLMIAISKISSKRNS